MTDEQKHAIEHAQKVLRAVKLYDLAASLAAPTILDSADDGESMRPVACYQCGGCGDNNNAPGQCGRCKGTCVEPSATRDASPIGGDWAEIRNTLHVITLLCEESGEPCDGFRFRELVLHARRMIAASAPREKS